MQYSDEQLNTLYKKLPKELLDAVYSEETAEIIGNACEQYGIEDARVSAIAKYAGQVLTGLLLPSEFEDAIRKNVELPEVLVKPIASEISRFVFYPQKAVLEELHRPIGQAAAEKPALGIATPRHSDRAGTLKETPATTEDYMAAEPKEEQEREVFSEEQRKQDPYREKAE